jgi:hypothetical protein
MSAVFPGVSATPAPTPTTPPATTVDPTTGLPVTTTPIYPAIAGTAVDPSIQQLVDAVTALQGEIAELKQNPIVAGLINADEVGPDRMGTNPFHDAVKATVGGFESDFRALVRDELSNLGVATTTPVTTTTPVVTPPASTTTTVPPGTVTSTSPTTGATSTTTPSTTPTG